MLNDSGIADAFYTIMAVTVVVIMGIVVSGVVLSVTAKQGSDASDMLSGISSAGMKNGIYGFYYTIDSANSDLSSSDPGDIILKSLSAERIDNLINIPAEDRPSNTPDADGSILWTGYLYVPEDGSYKFELKSRDGSWLWIDGSLKIDNHGLHALKSVQSSEIPLSRGYHPVKVFYFYRSLKDACCVLSWDGTGLMAPVDTLCR